MNASNITNYKPKDFAELLGVSVKTLQRWDREGILKANRTPTDRRYYTYDQYLQFKGINTENDRMYAPRTFYCHELPLRCFPLLCSGFFLLMEWRSLRPLLQADFHASMKSAHSKRRVNCNTKFSGNPAACVVGEKVPCYNKKMRLARSQCSQAASQP